MNTEERKKAYVKYLECVKNEGLSKEAIRNLNNAYNITEDDIKRDIDDIVKNSDVSTVYQQSLQMMVLMCDLRDYRDSMEIKKNRTDILKDIYSNNDQEVNTPYIFPL